MLPITTKDEIRFTPEHSDITYVIGVPSIAGRAAWQRALLEEGLRFPSEEEIQDAFREGIASTIAKEKQKALLEVVDKYYDNPSEAPPELKTAFHKLEHEIRLRSNHFRKLSLERDAYVNISILLAAKYFLKRVENTDIPFTKTGSVISDETFTALDEAHLQEVGLKAITYTRLTKELEKN